MDSGPIVLGVGMGATGLGIATTIANGDPARAASLVAQLERRDSLVATFVRDSGSGPRIAGQIPFDDRYFTGFVFGDSVLFWALSWSRL